LTANAAASFFQEDLRVAQLLKDAVTSWRLRVTPSSNPSVGGVGLKSRPFSYPADYECIAFLLLALAHAVLLSEIAVNHSTSAAMG